MPQNPIRSPLVRSPPELGLVTREAVASRLGLPGGAVSDLRKAGAPHFTLGRTIWYDLDLLTDWMREPAVPAGDSLFNPEHVLRWLRIRAQLPGADEELRRALANAEKAFG